MFGGRFRAETPTGLLHVSHLHSNLLDCSHVGTYIKCEKYINMYVSKPRIQVIQPTRRLELALRLRTKY